jgi:hypothetical protein
MNGAVIHLVDKRSADIIPPEFDPFFQTDIVPRILPVLSMEQAKLSIPALASV